MIDEIYADKNLMIKNLKTLKIYCIVFYWFFCYPLLNIKNIYILLVF